MAILNKSASPRVHSSRPARKSATKSPVLSQRHLHSRKLAEQQAQQQQQQKQHSAPSSPVATPLPPSVAVSVLDSAADSEAATSSAASASSSSPAPSISSMSSASSPQPEEHSSVEYSLAEQKMLDTIRSVSERIDVLARDLPSLQRQLSSHRLRLCLARWTQAPLAKFSFDAAKLIQQHKSLHYTIGMVDEHTLQQIFRLDSLQTDNGEIRKQRKAAVLKGNELIKLSVEMRQRMDKMKFLLPEAPPAAPAVQETPQEQPMEDVQAQQESDVEQMEVEEEKPAPKQQKKKASPKAASKPAAASTASTAAPQLTPLQRKYAHLALPTYAGPAFHARVHPHSGALLIEGDMEGVSSEDVSVVPDAAARTLLIRGVRLPERRRSHPFGGYFGMGQQAAPKPFGFFSKLIDLTELDPHSLLAVADVEAVIDRQQQLVISVPRKAQPQPQRRAPVTHSTGVSYSSDEEDAADAYSHPFQQYHQPQRSQYRRPAQPFFGGFW